MKKNNYHIEHIIEKLHREGFTNFVNQKEERELKGKLGKKDYKIYNVFEESPHVLLYKKEVPLINLIKIENTKDLRHQDIMGALCSLGLKEDTFGDIVKYEGDFYVFVLPKIKEYILQSLVEIKKNKIHMKEVDFSLSKHFKQVFQKKEIIVSSLRIDNVASTLTHSSRTTILDKFKNKEIILNYEEECKPTKVLQVGDIFSIKKYGKYKYNGIVKETKKGGFIIEILEYK